VSGDLPSRRLLRSARWALPALSLAAFAAAAWHLDPGLRPPGAPAPLPDEDVRGAFDAVVRFNRIYQDFYASGGVPSLLDDFPATTAVRHGVFRDLGYLVDGGYALVLDLAEADLREIAPDGPQGAQVLVYESWNYEYQRRSDRRPAFEWKGVGQGFRYRLRRQGGRWVVASWSPEDLEPPAPEPGR
jgi:hypothetical protein